MSKKRADGLFQRQITINGKRKIFYGHSERELNRKIADYKEEKRIGRKFSVIADDWEYEHFPKLAPKSIVSYKPALKRAVAEFGDMHCSQITAKQISVFLQKFAAQGYAQKTVATQSLVIHLIMNYAVLQGDIEYDPTTAVKLPAGLPKERRALPTAAEIEIVNNSVDATFGLFAYLILYTGCRRGEALALTYGDVDREQGVIHVTKSVYHESNTPRLKKPKTAAGCRDVILLDVLAEKIPNGKKNELLFPNNEGGWLHNSNARRLWDKYCEETGLKITPHQLRHAYATILYEAGIGDKDAQELLGHANISTTRDIYTHISSKRLNETAAKLNAATKR